MNLHASSAAALAFLLVPPPASLPVPDPAQDDGAEGFTQAELERVSKEIEADIARLRGVEFPRPVKVSVTDVEGLREYAKRRMDETMTPEDLRREDDVAHLLGVLPPEIDYIEKMFEVLEEQVGGFYDPADEAFFIMSSFGGNIARIIMSHELTHALDDQLYGIDGILESRDGNADAQTAFQAVVEGSGTNAMSRWTKEAMKERKISMSDMVDMQSSQDTEALATAPPFIWKPLIAVYMRGAAFLVRSESMMAGQMKDASNEDVDFAFRHPPLSTEQVLHPDKYWSADAWDAPVPLSFETASVPAAWEVAGQDTLGEMGLALVTWPLEDRAGFDAENPMSVLKLRFTSKATEGWGGDRYALLSNGDARVLHLATVWDTEADAAEFAEALSGLSEHLDASVSAFADGGDSGSAVRGPEGKTVALTLWARTSRESALSAAALLELVEGPKAAMPEPELAK